MLLPLVPAILMFRLVPGNAITLTGPLANLTLNASGAIAAYFAVLVAIAFFVVDIKQKASPVPRQYWTVIGKIELEDANGKPERFQRHADKIKVITNPEIYRIDEDELRIKVVEGESGLPSIRVVVDQFGFRVFKLVQKVRQSLNFLPHQKHHTDQEPAAGCNKTRITFQRSTERRRITSQQIGLHPVPKTLA